MQGFPSIILSPLIGSPRHGSTEKNSTKILRTVKNQETSEGIRVNAMAPFFKVTVELKLSNPFLSIGQHLSCQDDSVASKIKIPQELWKNLNTSVTKSQVQKFIF